MKIKMNINKIAAFTMLASAIKANSELNFNPYIVDKLNSKIGSLSRHKAKMKCKQYC